MTKNELKKLDVVGLRKEIDSLKKEFFNLRLARITGQVKDTSQFKKLRVQVAQAKTFLRQKENSNEVR